MKQKLIEALATKFGVDAKVVEGIAEKLSKTTTTEEEVTTAVEGVTFQQVLESYADKRANEASETARKNAIKKYETQYGLKDGKPLEEPKKDPEPKEPKKDPADPPKPTDPSQKPKFELPEEVRQALKDLADRNKALEDKMAQYEVKNLITSRRDLLNKTISKLTDAQKKPYSRIALDGMSDDEFHTFLEEVKADASAMEADNEKQAKALEAASKRPTVGTDLNVGGKASKDEIDAVMKGIH